MDEIDKIEAHDDKAIAAFAQVLIETITVEDLCILIKGLVYPTLTTESEAKAWMLDQMMDYTKNP